MTQRSRHTPRHLPVSVAELRRRLGERMTIEIDVILPRLEVIASASDPGKAVTGAVLIESIERGVTVRGEVTYDWIGDCRRCLEPVVGTVDAAIEEIFQVAAPEDSDLLDLVDDQVDLLPIVRDAVLVGLPLAPLCRVDCAGPDPDRYPTQTEIDLEAERAGGATRAASGPPGDPRWAALDQLRPDRD